MAVESKRPNIVNYDIWPTRCDEIQTKDVVGLYLVLRQDHSQNQADVLYAILADALPWFLILFLVSQVIL